MGYIEITKREILVCIVIIALLLTVGFLISGQISNHFLDKNEIYNKAVKLDDSELFQYGMRTDVGHAFVYGELAAVDPVTYPEIGGEYMYVEKVKEEYRQHTRVVTRTRTVNGKPQTYTTTEVYYSWDRVDSEDIQCETVSFCDVEFASSKIDIPDADYLCTDKVSSNVRYKYYVTEASYTGTIFTELKDETISDSTPFYANRNLEETVDLLEKGGVGALVLFWIVWGVLIGAACYGFCYFDNRWLT